MYNVIYSRKGKEEVIGTFDNKKEAYAYEDEYRKMFNLNGVIEDVYTKEVK